MKFLKTFNLPLVAVVFLTSIIAATVFTISRRKGDDKALVAAKRLEGQKLPPGALSQINEDNFLLVYLTRTCDSCSEEVDLLSDLSASSPGLKIFGVMAEDEAQIRNYVEDRNIKFPIIADRHLDMLRELRLEYFPTNLKIEKGVIKRVHLGAPESKEKLLAFIRD